MACIPHTVVPCPGVLGVSKHPPGEGRQASQFWNRDAASGRQPAVSSWRKTPWDGTAQSPVQTHTVLACLLAPAWISRWKSLPSTVLTDLSHTFTLGLKFTVSCYFRLLHPNTVLLILFTWVQCCPGASEVRRCVIIKGCE